MKRLWLISFLIFSFTATYSYGVENDSNIQNFRLQVDYENLNSIALVYGDEVYNFDVKGAFYLNEIGELCLNKNYLNGHIIKIENFFNQNKKEEGFFPVLGSNNRYTILKKKIGTLKLNHADFQNLIFRRIVNGDYSPLKLISDPSFDFLKEKSLILLGTYTTKYTANQTGRNNNILIASKHIDGIRVNPGENFSFNKVTGELKGKYSYATVINNNEYVQGIGGGLCQVSTTLFNSAIESGLNITSRNAHSKYQTYVPMGRDAMVSGWSDFSFKNNFSNPIYIDYESPSPLTLKFSIYGSANDKKNVKISVKGSGKSYKLYTYIDGKYYQSFSSYYQ